MEDGMLNEIDEYLGKDLPPLKGKKIVIYEGNMEIKDADEKILYSLKNGTVYFYLLPKPRIHFKGTVESYKPVSDFYSFESHELYLYVPNFYPAKILITHINPSLIKASSIDGIVCDKIEKCKHDVDRLNFYILNFDDTIGKPIKQGNAWYSGRIILNYDNWKITIDKIPNYKSVFKWLDNTGLYDITHVAKIERGDNKLFNPQDTDFLLEALFWLFSFVMGRYVGLDVMLGYEGKSCVWEKFVNNKVSNWRKGKSTWFSKLHPEMLEKLFPLFLDKFTDPFWKESIKMALGCYIESLKADLMEEAFIWVDVALESISWMKFTQEEKIISIDKYDKLYESDKIRLLLHDFGIPLQIPFNIAKGYCDGPHLFTEIRNNIVHPVKKEKIKALHFSDKWKAHELGLWYLELVILHLLGYDGNYVNRLKAIDQRLWEGDVEKVPWSQ